MTITHIAGTFLIDANGSFLNGAGLGSGEDRNFATVKTFQDGSNGSYFYHVPYVSSQSWRRWLRNTLIEETNWKESKLRALHTNKDGNTDKLGGEFNPVEFPEDDIFGYMRTEKGSGKNKKVEIENVGEEEEEEEGSTETKTKQGTRVKALSRASPFSSSILMSLRKSGWEGRDQGFVHLIEGSPQPYKTQFYNTTLQGIFCLNYKRLGVFSNVGDRMELDETTIKEFLESKMISRLDQLSQREQYYSLEKSAKGVFTHAEKFGLVYEIANAKAVRKERTSELLKALAILRGGAKQAAFGTDVSPKVLILAGLTCGNPILNSLFEDNSSNTSNRGKSVTLNVDTLKEVTTDYKDRLCTPVFIGIRNGYLANEDDVRKLSEEDKGYVVTTPINAVHQMTNALP